MYVSMYGWIDGWMEGCMVLCTYACMHVCMYAMCVYVCMCVCIDILLAQSSFMVIIAKVSTYIYIYICNMYNIPMFLVNIMVMSKCTKIHKSKNT